MAKIKDEEYPSNSKSKDTPQRVQKQITTGRKVSKKEPILTKMFGDNARSVGAYILWDVLIPAAKSTISDIISNGLEMLLYGEPNKRYTKRDRGRSYVSYNSIYDRGGRERRTRSSSKRAKSRFDDILIDSRAEAEEVLENLIEIIETYDMATVADFYQMVGVSEDWSDHKYGWHNLSKAEVERVREGWIVSLPRPEVLD